RTAGSAEERPVRSATSSDRASSAAGSRRRLAAQTSGTVSRARSWTPRSARSSGARPANASARAPVGAGDTRAVFPCGFTEPATATDPAPPLGDGARPVPLQAPTGALPGLRAAITGTAERLRAELRRFERPAHPGLPHRRRRPARGAPGRAPDRARAGVRGNGRPTDRSGWSPAYPAPLRRHRPRPCPAGPRSPSEADRSETAPVPAVGGTPPSADRPRRRGRRKAGKGSPAGSPVGGRDREVGGEALVGVVAALELAQPGQGRLGKGPAQHLGAGAGLKAQVHAVGQRQQRLPGPLHGWDARAGADRG